MVFGLFRRRTDDKVVGRPNRWAAPFISADDLPVRTGPRVIAPALWQDAA